MLLWYYTTATFTPTFLFTTDDLFHVLFLDRLNVLLNVIEVLLGSSHSKSVLYTAVDNTNTIVANALQN